jgi:hypothetical protein
VANTEKKSYVYRTSPAQLSKPRSPCISSYEDDMVTSVACADGRLDWYSERLRNERRFDIIFDKFKSSDTVEGRYQSS